MAMHRLVLLTLTSLFFVVLHAQIITSDGESLYGSEWINDNDQYLKIDVISNGLYRISNEDLAQAGWSLSTTNENRWQLWLRGQEVPVFVTSDGIYFFGDKNRGELDQHLFADPLSEQLNTEHSIYNDTASYFLGLTQEQSGISPARFVTENATDLSTLANVESITRTSQQVFHDELTKEFIRTSNRISIFYSHYSTAEGYGSRSNNDLLSPNGTTVSSFSLALPAYQIGEEANIETRFALGFDSHNQILSVEGESLTSHQSIAWSVNTLNASFTADRNTIDGALTGTAGERDKASIAFVKVDYPASLTLDTDDLYFELDAASNDRRLTFNNAEAGDYALFNLSTQQLQRSTVADFFIPSSSTKQQFRLVDLSMANTLVQAAPLVLYNPVPDEAIDYLIITSERLHNRENINDPIEAYATYRRSAAGGNHRVQVIDVETLYNTNAYGVKRHPLAIRNYQAALKQRHQELKFLFLIGKGREYKDVRTTAQLSAANGTFFLPSFGTPASDNLISASIDEIVPTLATGRLSAINAEEVSLYLDKVRGQEQQINLGQTLAEKDWLKQIIHLSGGGVISEQTTIRNLLRNMEEVIETNEFGGHVNSFFKTSSDPIEESREQAIFDRINQGTSIVTFFGHSSSQGFDFNIDNPSNYNNTNRYPLMLSLGCYSGDAFTRLRSIGERFVLLPNKGAIAFGASKGIGYISKLGLFAKKYYELLGTEMYGQSIGEVLNESIYHFRNEGSFTIRILLEQFGLIGDPAIRLYPQPGPDLVFDPEATSFEPSVIPAQQDSFTVKLRIVNIGRGTADNFDITLKQQLPNGNIVELGTYAVNVIGYDKELYLKVPNVGFGAIGANQLFAVLDSRDQITELPAPEAESNNNLTQGIQTGIPFFVVANTARPAFPPQFALHSGTAVQLTASTTNPLALEQLYHIQIDTNQFFNAPLATTSVTQAGGLINWTPDIVWQDSTTYYWRISPDSIYNEGQGFLWNNSSFTYLENDENPGWAVAHQGQSNQGEFTNITSSDNAKIWNFSRNRNDIRIRNLVFDPDNIPNWIWNGQGFGSPWPWITTNGIQLMVLDSVRNRNWTRSDGSGAYNSLPHSGIRSPWSFDTRTAEGRAGLMQFIEEGIPDGKYVTLYSAQRGSELDYGASDWLSDSLTFGKTIFDVLEDQGAEQVRQLINLGAVPYVFIFQKDVGPLGEVVAQDINSIADITATISENWPDGSWQSELIGPATQWESIDLAFSSRNISSTDSIRLRLYAHNNRTATSVVLRDEWLLLSNRLAYNFDISDISSTAYPYLSVKLDVVDKTNRTSASLEHFYVHYTGTADVAIDPTVAYHSGQDTLQQGAPLDFEIGYRNISTVAMDSLLINWRIGGDGQIQSTRQPPLGAGETATVRLSIPTASLDQKAQLQLQLNPNQDQQEQIVFNNDLVKEYVFDRDNTPPLLNLYFDGVSIQDGDLVSAKPEILVELRDDNPYLLLDDASMFTINLRYPDGSSSFIASNDESVEFRAATANNNVASLYIRPEFEQDGLYTISIQAGDRSGNASGTIDLLRDFEVITAQQVSNVFNYPNPFSERTSFVYTLTGDTPPDVFRIQIMTVSGRVVYDVDLAQEEQLKIGTHQTTFSWDGTDTYGDKLANGVYLYRVITKDSQGDSLEHYDNGTDRFFKNKLGKIVILR